MARLGKGGVADGVVARWKDSRVGIAIAAK